MTLYNRIISILPIPTLTKIELKKKRINAIYDGLINEARAQKAERKAIEQLQYERHIEWSLEDEEADSIVSRRLVAKARRLRVEIPPVFDSTGGETEYWQQGHFLGQRTLTSAGISAVREEIRKEQRWRAERRNHLIGLVPAITGLIGALTGLVALLRAK